MEAKTSSAEEFSKFSIPARAVKQVHGYGGVHILTVLLLVL